jgi:hypothetical protein
MEILILALVLPSVFIIIFGIILVGMQLDPGDLAYLLLLFALFIPAGVIRLEICVGYLIKLITGHFRDPIITFHIYYIHVV